MSRRFKTPKPLPIKGDLYQRGLTSTDPILKAGSERILMAELASQLGSKEDLDALLEKIPYADQRKLVLERIREHLSFELPAEPAAEEEISCQ